MFCGALCEYSGNGLSSAARSPDLDSAGGVDKLFIVLFAVEVEDFVDLNDSLLAAPDHIVRLERPQARSGDGGVR